MVRQEIQTLDGVWEGVSFVHWNGVRHTITRVEDTSCCATRGIQRENGLDLHVHSWNRGGLEVDLGHALTVRLRVERGLCEHDRVLLRDDSKLVVVSVVPDLLHIIP